MVAAVPAHPAHLFIGRLAQRWLLQPPVGELVPADASQAGEPEGWLQDHNTPGGTAGTAAMLHAACTLLPCSPHPPLRLACRSTTCQRGRCPHPAQRSGSGCWPAWPCNLRQKGGHGWSVGVSQAPPAAWQGPQLQRPPRRCKCRWVGSMGISCGAPCGSNGCTCYDLLLFFRCGGPHQRGHHKPRLGAAHRARAQRLQGGGGVPRRAALVPVPSRPCGAAPGWPALRHPAHGAQGNQMPQHQLHFITTESCISQQIEANSGLTVSTSAAESVFWRQLRMQPKQKGWSQPVSRPKRRSPGAALDSTGSRHTEHSTVELQGRGLGVVGEERARQSAQHCAPAVSRHPQAAMVRWPVK